jgi:hypothetical protein
MFGNIIKNIFSKDDKPLRDISRYLESKNNVSAILFGDSVSVRTAREDGDKRTLQEMVEQELSLRNISAYYFSGKGFHMRLYMHLLSAMRKNDKKPDIVVIPVNIRSFSPQWMYHPRWQFEKEIRIFCKKFGLPYTGTISKFPETADEYRKIPVTFNESDYSAVGDFMKVIKKKEGLDENGILFRRKQLFIFHYLYKLSSDNDRLHSLGRMIKENNFKLLLYFTPVNCAGGEELLGGAFLGAVEENRKIITDTVFQVQPLKNNVYIKDYTKLFDSSYFFSKYDPTEHLNEAGRKRLTMLLADDIEGVMKDSCRIE